ncbi:MAG: hypothetical protein ACRYF4_11425 [Janthinobacterium lividum]
MKGSILKELIRKRALLMLLSLAVGCSLLFLIGALYYANVASREADSIRVMEMRTGPDTKGDSADRSRAFTTDQLLSTLSINITVLGAVVGMSAIGVGVLALFGYNELRSTTFAKTEDDLLKIIRQLNRSGELQDATTAVLLRMVAPDRVFIPAALLPKDIPAEDAPEDAPQIVQNSEGKNGTIAKEYPGEL